MQENPGIQPLDKAALWTPEIVTDRAHGEIKRLRPIRADFTTDFEREPRYFATIIINTTRGAIPHEFEIIAASLEAAIDAYPQAAEDAGQEFIRGVRDAQLRNSLLGAPAN